MSVRKLTKSTFAVLTASVLCAFGLGLYGSRTGMLVFAAPSAVSLVFLAFLVFKRVIDPLILLTEAMKGGREGGGMPVPAGYDEFGSLASCVNRLYSEVSEITDNCKEVFASMPVPAIELDAEGKVVAVNDAAAGRCLPLSSKGEFTDALKGVAGAENPSAIELPVQRDDGSTLILLFKAVPLKKNGVVTGSLLIGMDDTRMLEMELDAVRSEAREAEAKLTSTIRDLEEFSLMTVRRERKMKEIREKLTELREGTNNTGAGA